MLFTYVHYRLPSRILRDSTDQGGEVLVVVYLEAVAFFSREGGADSMAEEGTGGHGITKLA